MGHAAVWASNAPTRPWRLRDWLVRSPVTGTGYYLVERTADSNCPILAGASRLIHLSAEPGTRRTVRCVSTREVCPELPATTVTRRGHCPKSITPCENRLYFARLVRFRLLSLENRCANCPLGERITSVDSGFGRTEVAPGVDRGHPGATAFRTYGTLDMGSGRAGYLSGASSRNDYRCPETIRIDEF